MSKNMSDSKKLVTVEWKGYCAALLTGVWQIYKDQLLVDVSLTCHQQGLKVHQFMLAIFFPGLKDAMRQADNVAGVQPKLCLDHLSKDSQGDVLKYLIEFVYSGKVSLPENSLDNVLEAAKLVGFDGLAQSIRDLQCGKRMATSSERNRSPGTVTAATNNADSGPAPTGDRPGTLFSTLLKRSNRKGIPMKLIKTNRGSPQDKNPAPEEPVSRAGRPQQMCGRDVRSSSSGRDSAGGGVGEGAGTVSSAGSSDEDTSSSSDDEEEEEEEDEEEEEEDDSQDDYVARRRSVRVMRDAVPQTACAAGQSREVLKCSRCDYITPSAKRFERHRASHDKMEAKRKENYECKRCPKSFRTRVAYKKHKGSHDRGSKEQQSSEDSSRDSDSRVGSDSEDGSGDSTGDQANEKEAGNKESGQASDSGPESKMPRTDPSGDGDVPRWTLPYEDNQREWFKCSRCNYMGTSKIKYARHCASHERRDAKRNERHECTVCAKVFRTNKGMQDHMVIHNPELQQKCKYCSFTTNQKWSLGQHLAIKHFVDEDDKPVTRQFQCPECDFECVAVRQLRTHVLVKHPKKKLSMYKCELCDYSNARRDTVREHMAVRHGVDDKGNSVEKSLKCAECDYTCHIKKQLSDHIARKHKPAPDKKHMCDECGYTTIYKAELRRHIDHVHRGVCRFMCDICGKRIKTNSSLKRHKRGHLGLKPFTCSLCGQAFADRHNLRKHNARHESGGDVPRRSVSRSSGTAKMSACATTASGASVSAAVKSSAGEIPEGMEHAVRRGMMDHAFSYCVPPASVDRLAYLGGMLDGYVGLRAAVERFDGPGSCGGIYQEL